MLLPKGKFHKRGWRNLKQVVLSLVAIMIAAGILALMVFYSLSVIRTAQLRILTGEFSDTASAFPSENIEWNRAACL